MAKALRTPIDTRLQEFKDYPYTISFVIRKRIQMDNLDELPKEKRPPFKILFYGTSEELDDWIDMVLDPKHEDEVKIFEDEVER